MIARNGWSSLLLLLTDWLERRAAFSRPSKCRLKHLEMSRMYLVTFDSEMQSI